MKIEIKSIYGAVIYSCEAPSLREAVQLALKDAKSLSYANLRSVDLRYADLRSADLSYADLGSADLSYADLGSADLRSADLRSADLSYADLRSADLRSADLRSADLSYALHLSEAINADLCWSQASIVPDSGPFFGWKKCRNGVIVQVAIGKTAKRSNATGRKCRAEHVKVLDVIGAIEGVSIHNSKVIYRKGEIVRCDKWNDNRWEECGGGIHFFLTRQEAEAYR